MTGHFIDNGLTVNISSSHLGQLEELLDIKSLAALKAPVMAACAAQFTALSNWVATLLLAPPPSQRERRAVKLLKVMNVSVQGASL